jgi:hypothetical protein
MLTPLFLRNGVRVSILHLTGSKPRFFPLLNIAEGSIVRKGLPVKPERIMSSWGQKRRQKAKGKGQKWLRQWQVAGCKWQVASGRLQANG